MNQIKIFSPATVANVSCGFDVLSFALDNLGEEMVFTKNDSKKVTVTKIEGANLPLETHKNAAGAVTLAMLKAANSEMGIAIEIYKKYKPGSGLGSSAASSSGAAFAINKLLGNKFSDHEVLNFARLGETAACGSPIADNVSAALLGGFILVRSTEPLDVIKLPTPPNLYVTVIHPQIEIKTANARAVLPKEVTLTNATIQAANLGGLISGLHTNDYDLIGRSVVDVIAEPVRKKLIPFFDEVKKNAMECGALGVGISGSGPSIFALSEGEAKAEKVAESMRNTYKKTAIPFTVYISKIGSQGVREIS